MRAALLAAVRFYQRAISPNLAPRCRFQPTCSVYALEAIEVHGAARGSWLALRRIVKCAPWHPGGVDLVPERRAPSSPSGTAEGGRSSSMPTPRASGEPTSSTAPAHPDHRATPALHGAPHEESPVA